MENWRDVEGWEGAYQVSDHGRVRSIDRTVYALSRRGVVEPRALRGKVLAAPAGKNGYRLVTFSAPGRREYKTVHVLVARAFLGAPPEGHEVRHRNGVRGDCALSNLHYGTRSQNAMDRHEHGTMNQPLGEACKSAKLTAQAVRWVRQQIGHMSQREMGRRLGVHHRTIGAVITGVSWSHVNG